MLLLFLLLVFCLFVVVLFGLAAPLLMSIEFKQFILFACSAPVWVACLPGLWALFIGFWLGLGYGSLFPFISFVIFCLYSFLGCRFDWFRA